MSSWRLFRLCKITLIGLQILNLFKLETPWQSIVDQFTIASYGPELIDFEMKPKAPPNNLLEKMLIKKAKLDKSSMKYYEK
jgi:hypothetical protein